MASELKSLKLSSPGRICLFGEHQDYLMLPVISAAISLRIAISGKHQLQPRITLNLPDIQSKVEFNLEHNLEYIVERDYFRSAMNVLRNHGFTFSRGFDCEVLGNIPIRAGTSSSSAMVVTWIGFLSRISDQQKTLSPDECARFAYEAEVLEFGEPGGMMDQYATAFGGLLYLTFFPELRVQPLALKLQTFVLGDSMEEKDTQKILASVKQNVLESIRLIHQSDSSFSLHRAEIEDIKSFETILTKEQQALLTGTLRNRNITNEAARLFQQEEMDEQKFGALLNEHQEILRDVLNISTPKINRMLDAALQAGALGGKINGSGGGGCMFVYAPQNTERIAEAIERVGGKAYVIHLDEGTRIESME